MQIKKAAIIPLIALATIAVVLTVVTAAVLTSQSLPSTGTITPTPSGSDQSGGSSGGSSGGIVTNNANLGVFSDSNATIALSNVDWGALTPDSVATKTIYVKNTGNVAEKLSLTGTAWQPESASSVLTLSWDKEGTSLAPGATVAATLTLTVADDTGDLSSFDLNIVVSGSV